MTEKLTCPHNCPTACKGRFYMRINDPENQRYDSYACQNCPCLYTAPEGKDLISTGTELSEENLREEARRQVQDAIAARIEDLADAIGTLNDIGMNNVEGAHEAVAGYMHDWLTGIKERTIRTPLEQRDQPDPD